LEKSLRSKLSMISSISISKYGIKGGAYGIRDVTTWGFVQRVDFLPSAIQAPVAGLGIAVVAVTDGLSDSACLHFTNSES